MIAASTTIPIIFAEIGFVVVVAGIMTIITTCIAMAFGKNDEDSKIFGLDASAVCCVMCCIYIVCTAQVAKHLTHTSKPQTVNESVVYHNQLDSQVTVEAYNLSINTDSTDIVPDIRKNYKNGNYDNDGTITLTKDHVSTSRKFDDITVSGPKDAVAIKQMKLVTTETKTHFLWWSQTDADTTLHITFSYVNVTDPQVKDFLNKIIGTDVK